jgi:hypothetical protein
MVDTNGNLISCPMSDLFKTPGSFVSNHEIQNHFSAKIQSKTGQIGRYNVDIQNIIELSEEEAMEYMCIPDFKPS